MFRRYYTSTMSVVLLFYCRYNDLVFAKLFILHYFIGVIWLISSSGVKPRPIHSDIYLLRPFHNIFDHLSGNLCFILSSSWYGFLIWNLYTLHNMMLCSKWVHMIIIVITKLTNSVHNDIFNEVNTLSGLITSVHINTLRRLKDCRIKGILHWYLD